MRRNANLRTSLLPGPAAVLPNLALSKKQLKRKSFPCHSTLLAKSKTDDGAVKGLSASVNAHEDLTHFRSSELTHPSEKN